MRKKPSQFNIKRGKIRQSWNKYNLWNMFLHQEPKTHNRTFFQQKWTAKSLTRAYHGEQVLEKHWKKQFNPTLRSVIPMEADLLAHTDGSEHAAGRGSGMDKVTQSKQDSRSIPYTNMVFAALERRLDVAIHRAMFASSTRQARQFVIHGYVKVNGKKMVHPSYKLNPGDMFQVEPERVLYAVGAPKDASDRRQARQIKRSRQAISSEPAEEVEEAEQSAEAKSAEGEAGVEVEVEAAEAPQETSSETLKAILEKARDLLATKKDDLSASRKRALRDLQRSFRKAVARGQQHKPLEEAVDEQMLELMQKLNISERDDSAKGSSPDTTAEGEGGQVWMSPSQKRELQEALQELKENPVDPTKPYATPWRPRPYLSPFAFIPRYLEVHHRICSAVYLRHPVARPGLSEVPTPFSPETSRLAFNWYLRNR